MRLPVIITFAAAVVLAQTQVDWRSQVKNKPFIDVTSLGFGAIGNGTLGDNTAGKDNSSAIQTAFNTALITGAEVYFPCGIYRHSAPLTVYGQLPISIVGEAENCTYLWYSGSSTQSQLAVSSSAPSSPLAYVSVPNWGFALENISLVSNGNVQDGITTYYSVFLHTNNTQIVGPVTNSYHHMGLQQSQIDVATCVRYGGVYNIWSGVPRTANGLVFDGWPGTLTTGLVTVNAPTMEYLSGIGRS